MFNPISERQLLNLPDPIQKQGLDVYLIFHRPEFKLYEKLSTDVKKYFLHIVKREFLDLMRVDYFLKDYGNDKFTYEIVEKYYSKIFNKYDTNIISNFLDSFNTEEYLYKFIDEIIKNNLYIPKIPLLAYESKQFLNILKYSMGGGTVYGINLETFLNFCKEEFNESEKNLIKTYIGKLEYVSSSIRNLLISKNIYNKKDINFFIDKVRTLTDLEELLDEVGGVNNVDKSVLNDNIEYLVKSNKSNVQFKENITNKIGMLISKDIYNYKISENMTYILCQVCYLYFKNDIVPFKYANSAFYFDFFIKNYDSMFKSMFGNDFPEKFKKWLDDLE